MGLFIWLDMQAGKWAPLFKVALPVGVVGFVVLAISSADAAVRQSVANITGESSGLSGGQLLGWGMIAAAAIMVFVGFVGVIASRDE